MATHSNVLAWRIPGTEEPGGLPSMGSHYAAAACVVLCVESYVYNSASVTTVSTRIGPGVASISFL